jgi:3-hydroxyisobutyrate dehydrogenase-like beta-hydroxyacid dehydrogenase
MSDHLRGEGVKVGFIGLGVMGSQMAAHLLRRREELGIALSVFNRTKQKAESFRGTQATVALSPKECADGAQVLILCLGDGASVREILFGPEGACAGLAPGAVVVDHSTISPSEAASTGAELAQRGFRFLDAPVTGGDVGARNGTLTIFVGGDEDVVAQVQPLLESYAKRVHLIGPTGSGQRMKAVNQIGSIGGVALMSEMLAFAERQGLSVAQCIEVLREGAAGSFALNWLGPKLAVGDFSPGFSVQHSIKDISIVLNEAREAGACLRITPTVLEALQAVDDKLAGNHSVFRVVKEG